MSQSLARLITHVTFSTKLRQPIIIPEVRPDLNAYLSGILNRLECQAIEINCVADHVHLLFAMSKTIALSEVMEELKKASSRWMKARSPDLNDFYWQAGYGAFSVSASNVEVVRRYILGQEQHHETMTFQDEFRQLLAKHGIQFDEQYIWD